VLGGRKRVQLGPSRGRKKRRKPFEGGKNPKKKKLQIREKFGGKERPQKKKTEGGGLYGKGQPKLGNMGDLSKVGGSQKGWDREKRAKVKKKRFMAKPETKKGTGKRGGIYQATKKQNKREKNITNTIRKKKKANGEQRGKKGNRLFGGERKWPVRKKGSIYPLKRKTLSAKQKIGEKKGTGGKNPSSKRKKKRPLKGGKGGKVK